MGGRWRGGVGWVVQPLAFLQPAEAPYHMQHPEMPRTRRDNPICACEPTVTVTQPSGRGAKRATHTESHQPSASYVHGG